MRRLAEMRERGQRGLAPFVTAGDGGLETTLAVLHALDRAGATCVELGLPFSDPIADGPVLQAAADRALAAGATFERVLEMLTSFRRESAMPVAIMTYANPLLRRGWAVSARAIAKAGGDALLVADLPVEEGDAMRAAAIDAGLDPIFFVSPTTSPERMSRAIESSRGFVYAIGRFGVTGARTELDPAAQSFLARVRDRSNGLPVAVGFGIATAADVRAAVEHADLAIVGSALVQKIHAAFEAGGRRPAAAAQAAEAFARELMKGIER
ncbi:MAG: tryptophan synthase subunit alpha [Planctomycetota bacterium]